MLPSMYTHHSFAVNLVLNAQAPCALCFVLHFACLPSRYGAWMLFVSGDTLVLEVLIQQQDFGAGLGGCASVGG